MPKTKVQQDVHVVVPPEEKRHVDEETGEVVEKAELTQSQRDRRTKRCILGTLAFIIIILLIIGLSVGLTQRNKTTATATSSTVPDDSREEYSDSTGLPRPVILDEDYGAFPDDIFSLALALELKDIMDVKAVVATSMDPFTSALCMAQHLFMAGRPDIMVFQGKDIHEAPFRAGIWIPEDLVGFPLREKCESILKYVNDPAMSGLVNFSDTEGLAQMLEESGRDDWVYITLGGMTTVAALTQEYPEAAARIKDMVVMGANVCGEKEIYDRVWAPVQETNVACDPTAANFVFSRDGPGQNLYVMPVGPGQDTIDGRPYQKIVQAAESSKCPGAAALLDFYFEWSKQARADETVLTHYEAVAYDPQVSSALRYDPTAVLYAAQLLTEDDETDDLVVDIEVPGILFDDEAFTHITDTLDLADPVSDVCPTLTELRFSHDNVSDRRKATVAIGYGSLEQQDEFLDMMADALACRREI